MAYEEEDFLLISGIQHFQFCKRQWALIHVEQQWEENVLTVEGQYLHQKADQPFVREKRGDKLVVRAMSVQSRELGMSGRCDVVEFIRDEHGVSLQGMEGKHIALPVEYKRGKPKRGNEDVLQLTAQALCLEEMLLCRVETGCLYYHEIRKRIEVSITEELREMLRGTLAEMHEYRKRQHTPRVKTGPHCRSCSLQHSCLPELMNKRTVRSYIEGKLDV